jgi:dTDP-4-dehydrorhamnose 3,5-epimerase
MKVTRPQIPDLVLIELPIYSDERGYFVERFNLKKFQDLGLPTKFVQDNHSCSEPSVLRGLHYQTQPSQGKLVGCTRGHIWDVAVDLRTHSPTFGRYFVAELSAANGRLLWIPPGFGHGFCVLGNEPADVVYKIDAFYNPKTEGGIRWDDPDLAIPWPIKHPVLSPRDEQLPSFADYRRMPPIWS